MTVAAAALVIAVILFFDWVPTPLNRNIAGAEVRARLIGGLIHTATGLGVIAASLLQLRWILLAGAIWYSSVLVSGILNWWLPWLTGITAGEIKPETYLREYARNTRVLPRRRRSPIVPDIQHTVIHLAVLTACIATWISFVSLLQR